MAYYFLFPEKDTTIYSHPDRKKMNTGTDEILELVKERGSTDNILYPSRFLVKFKNEDISDVIKKTITHDKWNASTPGKAHLQLTSAEPTNLLSTLNVNAYPLAESWDEGTGRYSNLPTSSNGASWVYKDNTTSATNWFSGSHEQYTIVFYSGSDAHLDSGKSDDGKAFPTASLRDDERIATGSIVLPIGHWNTSVSEDAPDYDDTVWDLTLVWTSSTTGNGTPVDMLPHLWSSYAESSNNFSAFGYGTVVKMDIAGHHANAGSITNVELGTLLRDTVNNSSSINQFYTASFATTSSADTQAVTLRRVAAGSQFVNGALQINLSNSYTASFIIDHEGVSPWGTGITGSASSSFNELIVDGGASWYTGSAFKGIQQFLSGDSLDIDMDVTHIIEKYSQSLFNSATYPTGIENNGFIVKKPTVIEEDVSSSYGNLQYFSVDTHTIHPPKLAFKWDDSTFGDEYTSNIVTNNDSLNVTLYNDKKEYNQNDVAKFRIHIRDKYPTRAFTTTSNYLTAKYFPTSSHYSIRDAHTEQEIIPFDHDYTKLSADSEGMFFNVYMKGLQPERYYRVLFRSIINNTDTAIYDDNYYFKVIR